MFRWYQTAAKCYVYLSDVPTDMTRRTDLPLTQDNWEEAIRSSRWFSRGWTLQELLAPNSVDFFSKDATRLGERTELSVMLSEITSIPIGAFHGVLLNEFTVIERLARAAHR
jgi:hypothetical protein